MSTARILYLTDKFRVAKGYEPAFKRLLGKAGIYRNQIICADIYNLVSKPLKRYGQEKSWKADVEKLDQIEAALKQRINACRPTHIAVSCPAVLGVLAKGDIGVASIEKMRGGVYEYEGIPVVVVYPITAIHRNIDERLIENTDGEIDKQEPYRIKHGATTLQWDWQKVGRLVAGKTRKTPRFSYSITRSVEDCYAARDFLTQCIFIAEDIETGHYPPTITCIGFTGLHPSGRVHTFVVPFVDESKPGNVFWSEDDHEIAWAIVREINESSAIKVMQNGNYDSSYFIRDGIPVRNYFLDSQYMWWSLYPELPKRLDYISSVLLDDYQYWKDDIKGEKQDSSSGSPERYWRYCGKDCHNTLFNALFLLKLMLNNESMRWNYLDVLYRLFSGLQMSMRGLKVDFDRMDSHRENLVREMESKIEQLRYILDEPEFNINSSAHKSSLLYDVFGLRERNAKGKFIDGNKRKTHSNAVSAGKIPMRMAKSEHPLFKYVLDTLEDALEPRVQLSNVFGHPDETKPRGIRGGMFIPTGRVRTCLNPVGTEMTRFSSKQSNFWDGGNLQNIRGAYKDFVIPDDESHVFLDVDFSQSDDVFIGYESQDVNKIAVIESGMDGHSVHAELFFGVPYEEVVAGKRADDPRIVHPIKGIRQNSKRIVHGTNFQMAAFTLYITMGRESVVAAAEVLGHADAALWDEQKLVMLCGQFMAKYRKKYPRLSKNEWYKEIANELKTRGKLTNAFGFTRTFLGDPNDGGTQREATSFYGQSNTGGNMNRVAQEIDWGVIPERFRDGLNPHRNEKPLRMTYDSHGFRFQLQVHDNYLASLNLNHPNWREAAHNLLQVMQRPLIIHGREFRVGSEAEIGLRWGKSMLEWDGKNPRDIEGIVAKLKQKERILA